MAEILVLEFNGIGRTQYDAVNEELGVDPTTMEGDWPKGIVTHVGGADDDGNFIVVELWESTAAQEQFMADRLGPALGKVGVPAPARVQWFHAWGSHTT